MSRIVYIVTAEVLKERTSVSANVDDKLIYPEIKAAQDVYILPLLGTALYNKILDDIEASSLTGVYQTLVDDYLIDCLCNYVLSELPEGINYQFTNKGVLGKTSENTERPSMSDMYSIVEKYKRRAEHYAQRTIKYLMQNSTSFTEYLNPGSGVDTIMPDKEGFTCPFYLGETSDIKRSFEERYQGNIDAYPTS